LRRLERLEFEKILGSFISLNSFSYYMGALMSAAEEKNREKAEKNLKMMMTCVRKLRSESILSDQMLQELRNILTEIRDRLDKDDWEAVLRYIDWGAPFIISVNVLRPLLEMIVSGSGR
jgi:hypothetical protein